MTALIALLAFVAGLACGLALRPGLDRKRRLQSVYKAIRARQQEAAPYKPETSEGFAMPRDYYLADRRQRGTLSEDFGLRRRAEDKAQLAAVPKETDDTAGVSLPRDYYERETPDDEGTLSENFGLRRREPPQDAA